MRYVTGTGIAPNERAALRWIGVRVISTASQPDTLYSPPCGVRWMPQP